MRITKWQKDKIRDALLNRGFDKENQALAAREAEIAMSIYRLTVSEADEKIADALNARIPGILMTAKSITFKIDGERYGQNIELDTQRAWPRGSIDLTAVPKDNPSVDLLAKLDLDRADYGVRRNKASAQAKASLDTISSDIQLAKAWPDIMPIVREIIGEPAPKQLPAIPVADLNAMFDLPVEVAA